MENTAIQHAFIKFDRSQKTPDFQSKPQNPDKTEKHLI